MTFPHRDRSHRRALVATVLLALTLALTLSLARPPASATAAEGQFKVEQVYREMRSMAKQMRGLLNLDIEASGGRSTKRFQKGTRRVEKAKHAMIRVHYADCAVYGMPFGVLFDGLETIDLQLVRARDASRKGSDKGVKHALNQARIGLSNLQDGFALSNVPEAARADLDTIQSDLDAAAKNAKNGKLKRKKLRQQIAGIEKKKHKMINTHFESVLVPFLGIFGVPFPNFYKLLEGIDLDMYRARQAARRGKGKAARMFVNRARNRLFTATGLFQASAP